MSSATQHPAPIAFVYRSVDESRERGRDWFEAVVEWAEDGFLTTRKVGGSVSKARAQEMADRRVATILRDYGVRLLPTPAG